MLRNNADARRCSYFQLGLPVVLQVTFYCETHKTPEIFMECFCVAKRKPVRHEKPKPQTARIVSLWFCGLLTCLELHCDWSLHN